MIGFPCDASVRCGTQNHHYQCVLSCSTATCTMSPSLLDYHPNSCPKYINRRQVDLGSPSPTKHRPTVGFLASEGALSAPNLRRLIRRSDTMFIATAYSGKHAKAVGADMSHRGGAPGFVQLSEDGSELWWEDYAGNNMFQTLGNLLVDPECSLLFVDYISGDALRIAGEASIRSTAAASDSPGAMLGDRSARTVHVRVIGWEHTRSALPIAAHRFIEASPYNPPIPSGAEGDAGQAPKRQHLEVLSVRDEATNVKTFEIAAPSGGATGLHAGMYAAFAFTAHQLQSGREPAGKGDATRTWTVSSHHRNGTLPAGGSFTVSVKREPGGLVSNHMHDAVRPGSKVAFLGFSGTFTLRDTRVVTGSEDEAGDGGLSLPPVLLLGAGIGVTPLRPFLAELRATQPRRRVVMLLSVKCQSEAAFSEEMLGVARRSHGSVGCVITSTQGGREGGLPPISDHLRSHSGTLAARTTGRVDRAALERLVPDVRDARVMMCGPAAFMDAMEAQLRAAGVDVGRNLHCERFDY